MEMPKHVANGRGRKRTAEAADLGNPGSLPAHFVAAIRITNVSYAKKQRQPMPSRKSKKKTEQKGNGRRQRRSANGAKEDNGTPSPTSEPSNTDTPPPRKLENEFGGYFIGQCEGWMLDSPTDSKRPQNAKFTATVHGKVISTAPYYTYVVTLNRFFGAASQDNYVIKEVHNVKVFRLSKALVETMFNAEVQLSQFQRDMYMESLRALPNVYGEQMLAELDSRKLLNPFLQAQFFRLDPWFRLYRVFPEHPGRILRMSSTDITQFIQRVKTDPLEMVVRGEIVLGLGYPNVSNYLSHFAAETSRYVEHIRLLEAMYLAQKRSRSTVLPVKDIIHAYRSGISLPDPTRWAQLVVELQGLGKLCEPKPVNGHSYDDALMFDYLRQKEELIIDRLNHVVANFKLAYNPHELQAAAASIEVEGANPEQLAAVRSIFLNPISNISGEPGTGKTQVLRFYTQKHRDAFGITFVGMQSVNLANRVTCSCSTIHSILFRHYKLARMPEDKRQLVYDNIGKALSLADTIIIEECGNAGLVEVADVLEAVTEKMVARKLARRRVPVTRIVFAGDAKQILPIELGQVGVDVERAFGNNSCTLHQNMRVIESSRQLVEIDRSLVRYDPNWFSDHTPDKPVPASSTTPSFVLETTTLTDPEFTSRCAIRFKPTERLLDVVKNVLGHWRSNYTSVTETLNHMVFLAFEKRDLAVLSDAVRWLMKDSVSVLLEVGRRFMVVDRLFKRKPVYGCGSGDNQRFSDEARNGQVFEVRRILEYSKADRSVRELNVLYRGINSQYSFIFVETACGKEFCIHEQYLDPAHICSGDVATVNKLQGGEADVVVAYLRSGISKNPGWTNAELHVLVSRARRQLVLIADVEDIRRIGARKPLERYTRMPALLEQFVQKMEFNKPPMIVAPTTASSTGSSLATAVSPTTAASPPSSSSPATAPLTLTPTTSSNLS